jgi:hypothetical protein
MAPTLAGGGCRRDAGMSFDARTRQGLRSPWPTRSASAVLLAACEPLAAGSGVALARPADNRPTILT